MQDFISMGGYGAYVWSSYVLTFVVFAWNVMAARAAHARALIKATRRASAHEESLS